MPSPKLHVSCGRGLSLGFAAWSARSCRFRAQGCFKLTTRLRTARLLHSGIATKQREFLFVEQSRQLIRTDCSSDLCLLTLLRTLTSTRRSVHPNTHRNTLDGKIPQPPWTSQDWVFLELVCRNTSSKKRWSLGIGLRPEAILSFRCKASGAEAHWVSVPNPVALLTKSFAGTSWLETSDL